MSFGLPLCFFFSIEMTAPYEVLSFFSCQKRWVAAWVRQLTVLSLLLSLKRSSFLTLLQNPSFCCREDAHGTAMYSWTMRLLEIKNVFSLVVLHECNEIKMEPSAESRPLSFPQDQAPSVYSVHAGNHDCNLSFGFCLQCSVTPTTRTWNLCPFLT